ncbi:MAG TPA: hypothetical protein VFI96_04530 [Longimicrobiaceae bacterium]|nr:hypothetical protein [Longimicrobiaceae bacterium]
MQRLIRLLYRFGTSSVLVGSLALYGYYLRVAVWPWRHADVTVSTVALLGSETLVVIAAAVLSACLAWLAADRADARALALFLALLCYCATGDAGWVLRQRVEMPTVVNLVIDYSFGVANFAALAMLLRFSVLFPRPLAQSGIRAHGALRLARGWLAAPSHLAAACALPAVLIVVVPLVLVPLLRGILGLQVEPSTIFKIILVAVVVFVLAAASMNLWTSFVTADPLGRRRVVWVLEGVLAAAVIIALATAFRLVEVVVRGTVAVTVWYLLAFFTALLVLVLCLAIAMFFTGAFDPRLAVRRTAVVGAVALVMIFLFAGAEQLMQDEISRWLGLSDHVGGVLTGGIVALSFEPVKKRVDRVVDRLLGGMTAAGAAEAPLEHLDSAPASS